MPKTGPLPKPLDQVQRPDRRAQISVIDGSNEREVPEAPDDLSAETAAQWLVYWNSPVSQIALDVDMPAIIRLFRMYDTQRQALHDASVQPWIEGSQGQMRLNPSADLAAKLDASILKLETELGLTPMSRQRLGIAIGKQTQSIDSVNKQYKPKGDAHDPRIERRS